MYKSGIQKIKESNMDEKLKRFLIESYYIIKSLEKDIKELDKDEVSDKDKKEIQKLEKQKNDLDCAVRNIYLS